MSLEELKLKLAAKQPRVELRYRYYEMKNSMLDLKISTPDVPRLTALTPCLGWCAKSVDAVADRLVFRDFKNDNFNMMEIFRLNNPDVLLCRRWRRTGPGSCRTGTARWRSGSKQPEAAKW